MYSVIDKSLPEYFRTRGAAAYLGLSTQFLEVARCRGDGPIFTKAGRAVVYRRVDLDRWMLARQHTNTMGGAK